MQGNAGIPIRTHGSQIESGLRLHRFMQYSDSESTGSHNLPHIGAVHMATAKGSKDTYLEPSAANALPYFLPLAAFPLLFAAAAQGGWWLATLFFIPVSVQLLERTWSANQQSLNPGLMLSSDLVWYSLPLWLWAIAWPAVVIFAAWQIFAVGHLAAWESVLLAIALAIEGRAVFIVGHELLHRRSRFKRYLGELLFASVSCPHFALEHIYGHHAHVGTPMDPGSAPRGRSFWHYFPRILASNVLDSWKIVRKQLARKRLPPWHYTNPFWRFGIETAAWYAFFYIAGGWTAIAVFMALCLWIVFLMKLSDYVQHYGLRRIRLPDGRFERVQSRHSWSASQSASKWMLFNMQRHADHHIVSGRPYPLLAHYGSEQSPHLPGPYSQMFLLALWPSRWFEKMDPLVDQWRAQFYPEIGDWSAYDSALSAARPAAFDAIVEIFQAAPRIAKAVRRNPELLDNLQTREFTDLEIPSGFGADSEAERIARSGLARVYWLHELDAAEMKTRLGEMPVQDATDAARTALDWSNDKTFQIAMHTLRGSLTPSEAGFALANVAQAAIATVLDAVVEDSGERHAGKSSVAAIVGGEVAAKEAAPRTPLQIWFICDEKSLCHRALCQNFCKAVGILTRDSLLFDPFSPRTGDRMCFALSDLPQPDGSDDAAAEILDLAFARCVFVHGDLELKDRFDRQRRNLLREESVRTFAIEQLRRKDDADTGAVLPETARRNLQQIRHAAKLVQIACYANLPKPVLLRDHATIFNTAKSEGLIDGGTADALVRGAQLWTNLHGFLRLTLDDAVPLSDIHEGLWPAAALSCGMKDFDELNETVKSAANDTDRAVSALVRSIA